ncbi:MAG: PAC2 family protein [Cryobacterium sp.]
MTDGNGFLGGRLLVVAFEGWNDAGEAATGAVRTLKELLTLTRIAEIDPEVYLDYQFNRPTVSTTESGQREILWPSTVMYGPADPHGAGTPLAEDAQLHVSGNNVSNIYLLLGAEPSRSWKSFAAEILDAALAADVSGVVFLGAMLADVPHTRPISIYVSSDNAAVRAELEIERSSYEGPVGILSVLADLAETVGIPTLSIWASVPHYVHNAPSPKAMLALIDKLEEVIDVVIPRGTLATEAAEWQSGIDALAADDDDMAAYIAQLEQARDTVDSPAASGEAIAHEFEKYLRKRGDGRDGRPGPAAGPGPTPA